MESALYLSTDLFVCLHVWQHLRDLVESLAGALYLKLGPDLKLLLLLLEVHQVPLVLQPGLAPLPELQKQSHCQVDLKKGSKSISYQYSKTGRSFST